MGKSKKTRQRILDVSIDLFATNGYAGTSIRDITRVTGMTISNIYYYFGSKEGLLLAILEDSTRQIVERLRRAADSQLEPLERFKLLMSTHLSLLVDTYRKEAKILFVDEEHLSRLRKEFQVEILNLYRRELLGLRSLGYIDCSSVTILAFNILGVINWHQRWYRPEGNMLLDQIKEEMINFVLHGALRKSASEDQPAPNS